VKKLKVVDKPRWLMQITRNTDCKRR